MCFAIAAIMMCGNIWAQEEKSKTEFRFNMGYDFSLKSGGSGSIRIEPEFGWNLTNQLYLGLATGLITDDGFDYPYIPALAHLEVNFNPISSITPYVGIMGGYAYCTEDGDYSCGVINPQVGIKVPVGKTTEFNIGVGYTHTFADGGGSDALGITAGLGFGGKGRGLTNFWKKCDKSIEVEMYTGTEASYESKYQTCTMEHSSLFGLRYSLLFPLFNHCYLGPSLGVGVASHKDTFYNDKSEYGWVDNYTELSLTAMLRAKYEIEQLTFLSKFYPYVQVEAGVYWLSDEDPVFGVNPGIGLSYKLGGGNSLDLSLSYSTLPKFDDDSYGEPEDESYGCLRLALGFSW